jgi:hypothetical protein
VTTPFVSTGSYRHIVDTHVGHPPSPRRGHVDDALALGRGEHPRSVVSASLPCANPSASEPMSRRFPRCRTTSRRVQRLKHLADTTARDPAPRVTIDDGTRVRATLPACTVTPAMYGIRGHPGRALLARSGQGEGTALPRFMYPSVSLCSGCRHSGLWPARGRCGTCMTRQMARRRCDFPYSTCWPCAAATNQRRAGRFVARRRSPVPGRGVRGCGWVSGVAELAPTRTGRSGHSDVG